MLLEDVEGVGAANLAQDLRRLLTAAEEMLERIDALVNFNHDVASVETRDPLQTGAHLVSRTPPRAWVPIGAAPTGAPCRDASWSWTTTSRTATSSPAASPATGTASSSPPTAPRRSGQSASGPSTSSSSTS